MWCISVDIFRTVVVAASTIAGTAIVPAVVALIVDVIFCFYSINKYMNIGDVNWKEKKC